MFWGKGASTKTTYVLSAAEWLGVEQAPFCSLGLPSISFQGTCFPSAFSGDTFAILMLRSQEFAWSIKQIIVMGLVCCLGHCMTDT